MMRRVWLVTRQEFRVRLRTGRWRWLLGGWVVLLLLFTALLQNALNESYSYYTDRSREGVPLFGILMLFVLGMMLVISPALTAGAVNGDRERGTLATLQVTTLRPGEIAVGKLLAGWAVGLVSLGLTLPFAGWAMLQGGIGVNRLIVVYVISALLMGVVCAISLAYSATLARTVTSTLLSYLTVGVLCIGTYIGFALVLPLTASDETVTTPDGYTYTYSHTHQEDVWWILAPNPFVVLADSAPRVDPKLTQNGDVIEVSDNDPLSGLAREVRSARRPNTSYDGSLQDDAYAVWPWGLGFDLLVGAGAVVIATRRLRTPSKRLGRGIRVA